MTEFAQESTLQVENNYNVLDENIMRILSILQQPQQITHKSNYFYKINKIMTLFPPALNANKFIYGKLIEIATNELLLNCEFQVRDLDEEVEQGSSYINDIILQGNGLLENQPFSIKAQKGGTFQNPTHQDITIVNVNSTHENNDIYNIPKHTCFLVMHISKKRLYIFRNNEYINSNYLVQTRAQVKYKSRLFRYLDENRLYCEFSDLSDEQVQTLSSCSAVNPNQVLYEKYIM